MIWVKNTGWVFSNHLVHLLGKVKPFELGTEAQDFWPISVNLGGMGLLHNNRIHILRMRVMKVRIIFETSALT
jgi:hypothetical protein